MLRHGCRSTQLGATAQGTCCVADIHLKSTSNVFYELYTCKKCNESCISGHAIAIFLLTKCPWWIPVRLVSEMTVIHIGGHNINIRWIAFAAVAKMLSKKRICRSYASVRCSANSSCTQSSSLLDITWSCPWPLYGLHYIYCIHNIHNCVQTNCKFYF